ncbi:hypothetical protein RDV84_05825 [Lysobacter yananisis]|uniref:Uncharacterized protein n=1 Tax=Lysobacter yananisis TaxID=1003114 RepID=A0ABY9PBC0_9GAMM|nr:hypothetical protein [Lysobacter yananisis]WMT04355.1 hypothetical protein RDV84_05825 [Lysobacter yananisis]
MRIAQQRQIAVEVAQFAVDQGRAGPQPVSAQRQGGAGAAQVLARQMHAGVDAVAAPAERVEGLVDLARGMGAQALAGRTRGLARVGVGTQVGPRVGSARRGAMPGSGRRPRPGPPHRRVLPVLRRRAARSPAPRAWRPGRHGGFDSLGDCLDFGLRHGGLPLRMDT